MSFKTLVASCLAGFFAILAVTLVFPSFPPGQYIFELLKIQQSTNPILGIPTASLIYGITNGLFWLAIGATAYSIMASVSSDIPLPPMPDAPLLNTPPPQSMPVDNRTLKIPPAITIPKVQRKPRTEYDVEAIEGIGPIRGALLRDLGIRTADDLLRAASSSRAQLALAKEVGVSNEVLMKWLSRGDLLRIRGIGTQYSGLLEAAGVNSVADLSTRNAGFLRQTLKTINKDKKLVKRIPPARTIRDWVDDAKTLEMAAANSQFQN